MFVAVGCAACHRVGDVGHRDLFGGSDLTRIADKRPADFFRRWLSDPAAVNARHRMPRFELEDEQLGVLSGFLASCRSDDTFEADTAVTDASLEHGRALLAERRCAACHSLSEGSAAPQEAIAVVPMKHWDRGCLNGDDRETASHPHYVLSDDDLAAIVEFLRASAGVDKPVAAAADLHAGAIAWEANNCQACHRRDGRGGLVDLIDEITDKSSQLVDLTPVMQPPALDGVGEKFHAAALRAAIANPPVRRSWLQMRMPKFALDDATLNALTEHFVAADRTPARQAPDVEGREIPEASLTAAGRRLVTSDGFGCTSCHRIGRRGAGEKRPEALGPKLDMLGDRVRREWFDRFVREPTRMVSGLEMPSIMAPVSGVLGDDLADQLDAVWHVLNQPGFNPPEPGALRIVRRSGHQDAGQRASVITDVLHEGGRTFVKPLLIGLPNRHNVLFDLESAGLAGWRLGDVAEQRTEGKSWYWQARGEPVFDKLPGVDVRLLRDGVEIEPVREGQFRTEFDALQFVDGGVRFTYRLFFPDASGSGRECVHVAETITAVWPAAVSQGGFRRLVELAGVPSADRVQLTVAESADTSSTPIPPDARRVELAADEGVSVELVTPASARLVRAGRTIVDVPSDDSARIELVYRTHLVADQFPAVTVPPAQLAAEPITTVPGFDGVRLGLPREIMPVALDWRSDGALLIATLKGRVWIARDTDGDGLEDTATVFCDGLAAPYGLATGDGYVDVLNKYALLRLFDDDGDDVADRVVRLTSGWGHTADYHDWAVGLPRDGNGGYFAAFPCQQDDRSLPAAALRGATVRFVPRKPTADDPSRFAIDVLTRGHRFPMGMARNRRGELFVTDNQGNYNPFNELNYIVPGARYGFVNKLERSSDFQPPLTPPAIDIPHPWTRSVNGICFLERPGADVAADASSFGPFAGHLVGCEYDTRRLVRLSLDRVGGGIQGAAYPLSTSDRATVDNFIGPIVCATSPGGGLYVGSIRDSGWGAGNNVGDVVRLRLDADSLPAGIREVRATADGFEVDFTRGVDTTLAADLANYSVSSYRRISTPQYGGDDVDRRTDVVQRVDVANDGLSVRLSVDDLRAGYLYELRLRNLAGGDAEFFPAEAYYTLRHIPAD